MVWRRTLLSPHGCCMDSWVQIHWPPFLPYHLSLTVTATSIWRCLGAWLTWNMRNFPRPKPSAGRKDVTELQKLKRVLRKNWIPSYQVPSMVPPIQVIDGKRGPSGSSRPRAQHEPHPHPVLTQAGSLHTPYHELMCQLGPPTSFEGCSDNEAGMDGSPIRLRRCLGGRFGIMCHALGPVGEEKHYKARS